MISKNCVDSCCDPDPVMLGLRLGLGLGLQLPWPKFAYLLVLLYGPSVGGHVTDHCHPSVCPFRPLDPVRNVWKLQI